MIPTIKVGNATLHTGDVLDVLKTLPSESIHCVVTSPPYWGLRDYGVAGQLGLEPTQQEHICNMVAVFREVRRVLRSDGTCWMNYGDCYAASANGRPAADMKEAGNDDRTFRDKPFSSVAGGLKPKDLCMMPARIALALQEDGWWIRSEIVWCKRSPMPESVTDRPTSATEKIYLMTKQDRYFYDAHAVRENLAASTVFDKRMGATGTGRDRYSDDGMASCPSGFTGANPAGSNLWNYWLLSSKPFPDAHFATFPPEIPKRAILAGTSERGVCAKCGAQWRRVVEKGELQNTKKRGSGKPLHGNPRTDRATGISERSGLVSGNFENKTIGWQIFCNCDAEIVPATVLDPFSGAGTTAMVALQLGRQAVGIELNPEYQEIARKRLEKHATQEVLTF